VIHPNSELRFINSAIGYGLFATRLIPAGTITWVVDPLDQIISPDHLAGIPEPVYGQALKYSYVNGRGDRVLCWDHARFVNHSCSASCLSPGFDFEIAVRDIQAGQELTDDYGSLNLEEPFTCLCDSPNCRGRVLPDDPVRNAAAWDARVAAVFPMLQTVEQPLWHLVREKAEVRKVLSGEDRLPSGIRHYLNAGRLRGSASV
jgi:hypothetical protein